MVAIKKLLIICCLSFLVIGCSAPNKVIYLKDAESLPSEVLTQEQSIVDPVIAIGDLLNISVFAADMAAVAPFNKGQYLDQNGKLLTTNNLRSQSRDEIQSSTDYYLVNTKGYINLPELGELQVAGKKKSEIITEITNLIYPKYVNDVPTVDVRLMNFRVSVLGQVAKPGSYSSQAEHMNILEAISLAGDLDIKGSRDAVYLYRTSNDGTIDVQRLNLNDRNLLLSPYFNLQQNDVIYVEPNRSARQNAWQMNTGVTTSITFISSLTSITSLVVGIISLSK